MTQKEINNFLANTKVYVNGKSEEIQKKLFSFGYKWRFGKNKVGFTGKPFLFINDDGEITHSDDSDFFNRQEETEITAEQILSLGLTECDKNKH